MEQSLNRVIQLLEGAPIGLRQDDEDAPAALADGPQGNGHGHAPHAVGTRTRNNGETRSSNGENGSSNGKSGHFLNGDRDDFGVFLAETKRTLDSVHGEGQQRERLGELMLRLGEPDTLEALGRVAVLVPDLEYALQAIAAGPQLLEEGLDAARSHLDTRGLDAKKLESAATLLATMVQPDNVDAWRLVLRRGRHLAPVVGAAADASAALAAVEGTEELRARLAEALTVVAEPEALESLSRIAMMAPQLEYAFHAVAA
ncbi:MAG: hypothetical protein AAGA56_16105, partial [Myxococcota bacterium]